MSGEHRSSREHIIRHSRDVTLTAAQDFKTPEEALVHYGVKGMKWGVRKERASSLTPLGPSEVVAKTSNGSTIRLTQKPPSKLHKGLAFLSSRYTKEYKDSAAFDILDSSGNRVGDGMVNLRGKDELYLNWIGINNSARGQGYATAALKAAQEFGQERGVRKLTLEVPGNAPDARHIYEKLGFKVTKEDLDPNDFVWGGLTSMTYTYPDLKHAEETAGTYDRFVELLVKAVDDQPKMKQREGR